MWSLSSLSPEADRKRRHINYNEEKEEEEEEEDVIENDIGARGDNDGRRHRPHRADADEDGMPSSLTGLL